MPPTQHGPGDVLQEDLKATYHIITNLWTFMLHDLVVMRPAESADRVRRADSSSAANADFKKMISSFTRTMKTQDRCVAVLPEIFNQQTWVEFYYLIIFFVFVCITSNDPFRFRPKEHSCNSSGTIIMQGEIFRRNSMKKQLFVPDSLQEIVYHLEYLLHCWDYSCVSGETPTSVHFINHFNILPSTSPADFPETGSSERHVVYAATHSYQCSTTYWSYSFTGRPNLGQLPHQHSLCWLIKGKDGGSSTKGTTRATRRVILL